MRAISNASGGFCFLVNEYEQGLTLFERESVLSLKMRDNCGRVSFKLSNSQNSNIKPDSIVKTYDYMSDPIIIRPKNIFNTAKNRVVDTSKIKIKRIVDEIQDLMNEPHPLFEIYFNEDDVTLWKIIYKGEQDTPYHGKAWLLYVQFENEYPQKPPKVRFYTPIYHSNINTDGKICHEVLGDEWNSQVSMRSVLESIANLIKYPNPLNALDSVKGTLFMDNREQYFRNAWESNGKSIEEIRREFNLHFD